MANDQMSVWIGNLRCYNEGRTVGQWIALPMEKESLNEVLKSILGNGEDREQDEYYIADSENWPCENILRDTSDPYRLNEIAARLEELSEYDVQRLVYLMDYESYGFDEAIEAYYDVIVYPEKTLEELAESLVDEGCFGTIPASIINYIDYEAIARDIRHDGYHEFRGGIYRYD